MYMKTSDSGHKAETSNEILSAGRGNMPGKFVQEVSREMFGTVHLAVCTTLNDM